MEGLTAYTVVVLVLALAIVVSAEQIPHEATLSNNGTIHSTDSYYFFDLFSLLWKKSEMHYHHVWPELEFGWRVIVGSVIGFFGAAFGSVGGVGGGGIFVPMLTLIIGFDPKTSTAISKCMITGAAGATVYYSLKLRHPLLELPIIDYDLVLLFQPMLLLGISIGVVLNVIFAEWMVTMLLIILFLAASTKAFFKGIETWKKETIIKKEAVRRLTSNGAGGEEVAYKIIPGGPNNGSTNYTNEVYKATEVSIVDNMYWKDITILIAVWIVILALHIFKNYAPTCSTTYWILNLLQVSSATAAFVMIFSSSMSVIQYYLLRRFPVPYALYFIAVASIAALVGQHVVRRIISIVGRASVIIFILAFTIFVSAISLGGVGIADTIKKIEEGQHMGFDNICAYN
ncbi:sulfite exporter TauE/SafE family protein 3-like isoform X3 [Nicotiana tomentosiformis]|uniref:sulfite exporter TauE/SafE family protein 3-like isoform X3 n=1 Tax=Nicotiana tomentosiformis TaxID=4098 RepID=UPI00051C9ED6|nr:sulfite exporter TauE/SafE family protein 3-like isoform X3 [Nicotiana tomentosiformis]